MAMTRSYSEHKAQCAVIEWARWQGRSESFKDLLLLFAVPNGGLRDKGTGRRLKLEGVLPGVPDLFLPAARQGFHGLFIEMKSAQGRVSEEQKATIEALAINGYRVHVARSANEAITILSDYMGGKR